MSGLDVLGAVAAAAQLAATGLEIVKLISSLNSHVKDAPSWIKGRKTQIQHLVDIAGAIQNSPVLQTDLIQSLLESCNREARDLENVLTELDISPTAGILVRYWKAVGGMKKERRIAALCDRIEEEKSALTLCIVSISSSVKISM